MPVPRLELTSRSSPGSVPTADIQQYYLGYDLTKLAGFISGAPPNLLYNIMSAATEFELRALLATVNPLEQRLQPNLPMISTCMRITRWLENCSESGAISKDVVPCALFLLLKVRVLNRSMQTYDETIRLGVAIKIAYGNICDGAMWRRTMEYLLDKTFYLIQETELAFLYDLDWRSWVRETDFKEFVWRFEIVWEMLLERN